VFLLNSSGVVLQANRVAAMILNKSDGLSLSRRELAAAHKSDHLRLQHAIQKATGISTGICVEASIPVIVKRPSGRRPFVACIAPLTGASIAGRTAVSPQPFLYPIRNRKRNRTARFGPSVFS